VQIDLNGPLRREQDLGRGTALLVTGAVMVLLKWVLPPVAPLAIAAYGVYRLYHKAVPEGLLALVAAAVVWFLRAPLGWLLWVVGGLIVAWGLFLLIRGLLAPAHQD
jgi:hypothetical protein